MAAKPSKKTLTKGERLGWTPVKEVKRVTVTVDLMKGQKVVPCNNPDKPATSLLIP